MNAIRGPVAPETEGNIYEFRSYRLVPGAMRKWVGLFTDVLPVREKYSKLVGLWSTDVGQPNEVCHIWAYPSLDARAEVRAKVAAEPEWQAFLKADSPLIDEMHSTIMVPAKHSPLK